PGQQSPRPEALQRNFKVRSQIVDRPSMPVGLRRQTAELAVHMGSSRQISQTFTPGRNLPLPDQGLRKMIEHENLIRVPVHKPRRRGKVPLEDQNVVNQSRAGQRGDAAIEVLSQYEIIIRLI